MCKSLPVFALSLVIFTISSGQNKQDKQIVKRLDQLIAEKYKPIVPGCAVLVAKKGEIIYKKAFGTANLELKVPMKPDMIFRIGSITKQYTAIAILQLVEQRKISLQDSIQKFIKEFHGKGYLITIGNMLAHTSGITDYEVLDAHIPNAIRVDFPAKQVIDSLAKLPLEFPPGSKYSYSNSNYFLLGYIIEQVSGKSYKDYLAENIFKPADLSNTYYDSPAEIIPGRSNGYSWDGLKYQNTGYISMSLVYSAGALLSNVEDLYKWHQALNAYKLIKKETVEKAFTPFRFADGKISEYGYGWFIKDLQGSKSIGHGGRIDGFRSMETYVPGQDIFITELFNSDNESAFNLFDDIASVVLGKSGKTEYTDLKIGEATLDSYTGVYVPLEDTTQSFKIYKENGRLYADLSNGTGTHMALMAQSITVFYLPDVRRIPTTIEFIAEAGKISGLYWTQEKRHECRKMGSTAVINSHLK